MEEGDNTPAQQPVKILLVVGLGNPGAEYQDTRHNMGFSMLDAFAGKCQTAVTEWQPREGLLRKAELPDGNGVFLLKPMAFMNASGGPVAETIGKLGISPRELLVISDDLDMPLGRIRLRMQGSAGGHRGLLSIAQCLGTTEYPRLRLGIGRPRPGAENIVEWVLGHRTSDEEKIFQLVCDAVCRMLQKGTADGFEPESRNLLPESDNIHAEC